MKLTEEQKKILTDLVHPVRYGEDGYATAQWIAESCGHYYDTPWASTKLPGLFKRGFIEKGGRGYYRITPAGRAALEQSKEQP